MYELFNQMSLPYKLRKDVKFLSCNIRNIFMVLRHFHIYDEKSKSWILPKTNALKQ